VCGHPLPLAFVECFSTLQNIFRQRHAVQNAAIQATIRTRRHKFILRRQKFLGGVSGKMQFSKTQYLAPKEIDRLPYRYTPIAFNRSQPYLEGD